MTVRTPGAAYASALSSGAVIGPADTFYSGTATMAELFWGSCGAGSQGVWLGLADRYLGLRFISPDNSTHYGWAKISTVAYVDASGHLHGTAFVSGFAYESLANQPVLAGQTSD